MSDRAKPSIALFVVPETSSSVLYGLYDVLLSVGAVYSDMTTGQPEESLLDVKIVAGDDKSFRCFGDVLVEPHASIDVIERADVVLVCDMYSPIHTPPHGRYRREIDWLKRMHAAGSTLVSVCSGSLLLAETGLLDGVEVLCEQGGDAFGGERQEPLRVGPDFVVERGGFELGEERAG